MNKKILSLIILFLGVFSVMQAQNDGRIRVKGIVLDETTYRFCKYRNYRNRGGSSLRYGWFV